MVSMAHETISVSESLVSEIVRRLGADTSIITHEGFTKKAVKCPFSNHEHDDSSPSGYWHVQKHFFKCFKCGDTKNAHETAEALGIDPKDFYASRKDATETKRKYEGLADYAKAHGVDESVLKAAGWKEGTKNGRPAILFPTANGNRYRLIDGQSPRFLNDDGYKACWYGLDRALDMARRANTPLILCNGEASTVVAQHYGLPACCVTSGEKSFNPQFAEQLREKWNGPVIIAMDCDKTGQDAGAKIAGLLSDMNVAVKDLGFTDGGDLADFCKLHTAGALKELQKGLEFKKPDLNMIAQGAMNELNVSMQALTRALYDQASQPDVEDIIRKARVQLERVEGALSKPLVVDSVGASAMALNALDQALNAKDGVIGLPVGFPSIDRETGGLQPATVTVVYGATSMGKSVFLSSAVANIMQRDRSVNGLIIPTETTVIKWLNRIAGSMTNIPYSKINKGQLTPEEVEIVKRALAGMASRNWQFLDAVKPTLTQIRSAVHDAVKNHDIQIVVIDSVSNLYNAGDYSEVAAMTNGLLALSREVNLPFLVSSQVGRDVGSRGKGQKIPKLSDGYGGGVLENNAETVISLYRHAYYVEENTEEENDRMPANTGLAVLSKVRDGEKNKKIMMHWKAGARYAELTQREADYVF